MPRSTAQEALTLPSWQSLWNASQVALSESALSSVAPKRYTGLFASLNSGLITSCFLIGAIANTLLFLFISIPLAEGHQSRKEGFLQYKKETRMLLPLPKSIK